jgi:hypothetical protein
MKKPEPKEYVIQPKGWKKRYKCHKNKGDHTFVLDYAQKLAWYPSIEEKILVHYVCNACGKKSIEIEPW